MLHSAPVRIAVSGTHCSGKSTLVGDFLAAHRDYVHEPEPYEWLAELHGDQIAEASTVDNFYSQLEMSVVRLRSYGCGARVIAERSPLDFVAYILALGDLHRDRYASEILDQAVAIAAIGIDYIDLLVVLPLNDRDRIAAPIDEDLELREAMNERLVQLLADDEFGLLSRACVRLVELDGSPERRLGKLEQLVGAHARNG